MLCNTGTKFFSIVLFGMIFRISSSPTDNKQPVLQQAIADSEDKEFLKIAPPKKQIEPIETANQPSFQYDQQKCYHIYGYKTCGWSFFFLQFFNSLLRRQTGYFQRATCHAETLDNSDLIKAFITGYDIIAYQAILPTLKKAILFIWMNFNIDYFSNESMTKIGSRRSQRGSPNITF